MWRKFYIQVTDFIILLPLVLLCFIVFHQAREIDNLKNELRTEHDRAIILEEQLRPKPEGQAQGQTRNRWEAFKVHPVTNK